MEEEHDKHATGISVLPLLVEGLIQIALVIGVFAVASFLFLLILLLPRFLSPQLKFFVDLVTILLSPIPTIAFIIICLLRDLAVYLKDEGKNSYDPVLHRIEAIYAPLTVAETFKPIIADWHFECLVVSKQRGAWKACWITLKYIYLFILTILVSAFVRLFDCLRDV